MSEAAPVGVGTKWRRRRSLAWAIRTLCIVVPMLASIAAMDVAGHLIPRFTGGAKPLWYVLLFAISFAVLVVAQRIVRRLLPLATLLDMTLEFPDLAPSRLSMSRRAHSARELSALMDGAHDETTQQAAERVLTLLAALAKHDRATRGHAERVRAYTDLLALRMGLSSRERDRLRWASLLHDIGKLHVPATLLTKPSKPSSDEWDTLRRHPAEGSRIATALLPWLGEFGPVIEQHHERFDGNGYPNGMSGHNICRGARIVAVADTFEVITAPRPYKRPIKREAALAELVACSGTQFDPEVVRAFLAVDSKRMLWAMGPTSWLAGLPLVGQAPAPLMAAIGNQTMNLTTAAVVGAVSAASVAVAAPAISASSVSHETQTRSRPAALTGQPNSPTRTTGGPSSTRSYGASTESLGDATSIPLPPHPLASTSTGTMPAPAVSAGPAATPAGGRGAGRGGISPSDNAPPTAAVPAPPSSTPAPAAATPTPTPTAAATPTPAASTPATQPDPTPQPKPAAPTAAPPPTPATKPTPAPKPTPKPLPLPLPLPKPLPLPLPLPITTPTAAAPAPSPTAAPKPPKPTKPPKGNGSGNSGSGKGDNKD